MKLDPIIPFEPIQTDQIPLGERWVHQVKWDGVRILSYSDGRETALFNRRKIERTAHFPELMPAESYSIAQSAIFDGEVIALDESGKPSFHQVMKRDGIHLLDRVSELRQSVPIFYMIFDLLYVNGEWIIDQPFQQRYEHLSEVVRENQTVKRVRYQRDGQALFDAIVKQDLEGIVSKDLTSTYAIHQKGSAWKKVKNYKDIIAVVGGVTYRETVVNALILGLYNQKDQFVCIGYAGTGKLTRQDWQTLTDHIGPFRRSRCPFSEKPKRSSQAVWLVPRLTVKIQYLGLTTDNLLRQPSIQAFVIRPSQECRLEELI
ncbi:MAG: DNA ligase [Sporolactobacillus sp.]